MSGSKPMLIALRRVSGDVLILEALAMTVPTMALKGFRVWIVSAVSSLAVSATIP